MTGAHNTSATTTSTTTMDDHSRGTTGGRRGLRILLFSDDRTTREAVRLGVGRHPARDLEVTEWQECATPAAVFEHAQAGGFDLFILDGEAAPFGGMGVCRQLKHEIFECPPVIVLTGRPQDAWLTAWSYADLAVPHPLDPLALASAVEQVARRGAGTVDSF